MRLSAYFPEEKWEPLPFMMLFQQTDIRRRLTGRIWHVWSAVSGIAHGDGMSRDKGFTSGPLVTAVTRVTAPRHLPCPVSKPDNRSLHPTEPIRFAFPPLASIREKKLTHKSRVCYSTQHQSGGCNSESPNLTTKFWARTVGCKIREVSHFKGLAITFCGQFFIFLIMHRKVVTKSNNVLKKSMQITLLWKRICLLTRTEKANRHYMHTEKSRVKP